MKQLWQDSDTVPAIQALENLLKSDSGHAILRRLQERSSQVLLFHGHCGGEYRQEFYLEAAGIVMHWKKLRTLPVWIAHPDPKAKSVSAEELFKSIPTYSRALLEESFPTEHLLPGRTEAWLREQIEKN